MQMNKINIYWISKCIFIVQSKKLMASARLPQQSPWPIHWTESCQKSLPSNQDVRGTWSTEMIWIWCWTLELTIDFFGASCSFHFSGLLVDLINLSLLGLKHHLSTKINIHQPTSLTFPWNVRCGFRMTSLSSPAPLVAGRKHLRALSDELTLWEAPFGQHLVGTSNTQRWQGHDSRPNKQLGYTWESNDEVSRDFVQPHAVMLVHSVCGVIAY